MADERHETDVAALGASVVDPPSSSSVPPRRRRRLGRGLVALCAILLLLDLVMAKHGSFRIEERFAFQAGLGFVVTVLVVVLAQAWRVLVGRPEEDGDA